MIINRKEVIKEILSELAQHRFAILRQVQIDQMQFNESSTTICFISRDGEYYAFVEPGLQYTGRDNAVRRAFAPNVTKGWRQILIPTSLDLQVSLQSIDALLGLDGKEPSTPWLDNSMATQNRNQAEEESVLHTHVVKDDSDLEPSHRLSHQLNLVEELVSLAEKGKLQDPIGRESIIDSVIQIVCKSKKNSCILTGEPGVGKTAIVEGLAIRIQRGDVPPSMRDKRIYSINIGDIVAESAYFNELLARIKNIVEQAKRDDRVILFIDEAHMITDPKHDVSQFLKAPLARNLRVIAATTTKEYFTHIASDQALARRLQRIPVPEVDPGICLQILQTAKVRMEKHHNVDIPDGLLPWVIKMSIRFVKDRTLPDKAIDLLDESCARMALVDSRKDLSTHATANFA